MLWHRIQFLAEQAFIKHHYVESGIVRWGTLSPRYLVTAAGWVSDGHVTYQTVKAGWSPALN